MELLKYVQEQVNAYTVDELFEDKICVRILNKEELIEFIKKRNKHNIAGCHVEAWDYNVEYITEEYGFVVKFNRRDHTVFATDVHFEDQGYRVVNYKDINIKWNR